MSTVIERVQQNQLHHHHLHQHQQQQQMHDQSPPSHTISSQNQHIKTIVTVDENSANGTLEMTTNNNIIIDDRNNGSNSNSGNNNNNNSSSTNHNSAASPTISSSPSDRNSKYAKPPYSYVALIAMAIQVIN